MSTCTLVLTVLAVLGAVLGDESYTSRWDNVNVDPILKNERLLKTYLKCVLDQGSCSPDAAELKKNIPDALENECSKCTEKQRENVEKVMRHIYNKKPDMFNQLEKKYDPRGVYRAKYTAKYPEEAKREGVKV
uniref:Chemosensory protein 6 n=1 Tax=Matsumurasca onukii TaxID=2912585 RepID=A0A343WH13_MATON|nr:chemosensory protein 6 [Matsumurasca onukii]WCU30829.1 chemosensory protein [Matsumurasca onukii]